MKKVRNNMTKKRIDLNTILSKQKVRNNMKKRVKAIPGSRHTKSSSKEQIRKDTILQSSGRPGWLWIQLASDCDGLGRPMATVIQVESITRVTEEFSDRVTGGNCCVIHCQGSETILQLPINEVMDTIVEAENAVRFAAKKM